VNHDPCVRDQRVWQYLPEILRRKNVCRYCSQLSYCLGNRSPQPLTSTGIRGANVFRNCPIPLISPVEDAHLISRLAKRSSCLLSICGGKAIRLWPGLCSSACAESCQGTCQRSTPKACPLSCMPASAARPGLTIGCACSYSNGPARPCSNIRHRRY
jgi:hypothetical protein